MIARIDGRRHPLVVRFRALAEEPDPAGARVLLDGAHLVREAQVGGQLEVVAVAASRLDSETEAGVLAAALSDAGVEVVAAPDGVFAALSPVRTPSGIVAIAARRTASAQELCAPPSVFILVAVDVQDPGNIGALMRAGEAGGVTGMFVCGASANPFSWKAVRGSMGSVLRLPVVAGMTTDEVLSCLRASGVRSVAAVTRGGMDVDAVNWSGKVAVVLGGEGAGLPDAVVAVCDARVSIPMSPHVDSLNVAAAGAILVYAARRQRT